MKMIGQNLENYALNMDDELDVEELLDTEAYPWMEPWIKELLILTRAAIVEFCEGRGPVAKLAGELESDEAYLGIMFHVERLWRARLKKRGEKRAAFSQTNFLRFSVLYQQEALFLIEVLSRQFGSSKRETDPSLH